MKMVSFKALGTSSQTVFFFLRCIQNSVHAVNGRRDFILGLLQAVSRVKLSTCSCGPEGDHLLGQAVREEVARRNTRCRMYSRL